MVTQIMPVRFIEVAQLIKDRVAEADLKPDTVEQDAGMWHPGYDNFSAWRLATSTDPLARDGALAVELAQQAVAATRRKDPQMLDTLAAAYAEVGQFAKAGEIQKEAITLLESEETKQEYAARLKLYESGFPYRDASELATTTSALLAQGKFAEAEQPARECLALREGAVGAKACG